MFLKAKGTSKSMKENYKLRLTDFIPSKGLDQYGERNSPSLFNSERVDNRTSILILYNTVFFSSAFIGTVVGIAKGLEGTLK